MRLLAVTFVLLVQCGFLFGQDGSNIDYVKTAELNQSYIGRKMHLDFNQMSFVFFPSKPPPNRSADTVIIGVNGKKVKFIEHRVDDNFNAWFFQQYLESAEEIEGSKLRITEFELLKINKKGISVKAFFVFVDKKEQILPDKSFTKEISFEKKEIVEFLFKAKEE
jgi:hypothetical protein